MSQNSSVCKAGIILLLCGLIVGYLAVVPVMAVMSILTGHVYDMELQPVVDARVSIDGAGSARTDSSGRYELGRVPQGRVTVKIEARGYRTDVTEISISRRFEEFVSTLQRDELPEADIRLEKVPPPVRHGNIWGLSGRIELPDVGVFPVNTWNVSYHHFRTRGTAAAGKQTITTAAMGGSPVEDFEMSLFSLEARDYTNKTPFMDNVTGGQMKILGRLTDLKGNRWPYAVGGRHNRDDTDEVFIAFEIPVLDRHRITLVPTWDSRAGGILLHLGWEQELLKTDNSLITLLLEAMQTPRYHYRKFNAGFRMRYRDLNALDIYMLSDTERNLRSYGVGASMLFR